MFSDPGLHDKSTALPAADGRPGAGRARALIAYVSVLSASVAAAAALITVGIPV
jgi:hypothetical protein